MLFDPYTSVLIRRYSTFDRTADRKSKQAATFGHSNDTARRRGISKSFRLYMPDHSDDRV
ncbi:hypothetical protein M408DRAFT_330763, partial [Serendipita vermifera MAFF 305830]